MAADEAAEPPVEGAGGEATDDEPREDETVVDDEDAIEHQSTA